MSKIDEVLGNALQREKEIGRFFAGAAVKSKDPRVKSAFELLAKEDASHVPLLEKLIGDSAKESKYDPETIEAILDDMKSEPSQPVLSTALSPKEAMELATMREAQASELYIGLKSATKDGPIRDILDAFMTTEMRHRHSVATMYSDSGFPSSF